MATTPSPGARSNEAPAAPSSSERLRGGLRASSDPRAERTRARILEAAHRVSIESGDVSVAAIVREACVSRSAFYTHFADLGELAERLHEPHFARIAERATIDRADDAPGAMLAAQHRLVEHFARHRRLYATAFRLPGSPVEERVEATIRAATLEHLIVIGTPLGIDAPATARYVAAGATSLIRAWIVGELPPAIDLANQLYALMPAWMHEAPHTPSTSTASPQKEIPS